MRKTIYIAIMTLTYPIWKISLLFVDMIFFLHKKLVEWTENVDNDARE